MGRMSGSSREQSAAADPSAVTFGCSREGFPLPTVPEWVSYATRLSVPGSASHFPYQANISHSVVTIKCNFTRGMDNSLGIITLSLTYSKMA